MPDETDRAQNVAAARAALGMTQEQIAQCCGTSRNTVWRYETGGLVVPDWYLVAIVGCAYQARGGDGATEVSRILGVPLSEVPA